MNPTPRQSRLARINALYSHAELLETEVKQPPVREQLALAKRDLREAEHWLEFQHVDDRPTILAIADLSIALAKSRLDLVRTVIDLHGPDVVTLE